MSNMNLGELTQDQWKERLAKKEGDDVEGFFKKQGLENVDYVVFSGDNYKNSVVETHTDDKKMRILDLKRICKEALVEYQNSRVLETNSLVFDEPKEIPVYIGKFTDRHGKVFMVFNREAEHEYLTSILEEAYSGRPISGLKAHGRADDLIKSSRKNASVVKASEHLSVGAQNLWGLSPHETVSDDFVYGNRNSTRRTLSGTIAELDRKYRD